MGNAASTFSSLYSQSFRIASPPITEKNLEDQNGKVFLITGSNTGVGYHVAEILYQLNGSVWIAARTESKAQDAISKIKAAHPNSQGKLNFLQLDLSDLTTIKASAEKFLASESRLDWLDNNAGVMVPPPGTKGAQGMELQYQTNILGPFLFTKLLHPLLHKTAASVGTEKGSVRVSWAGSSVIDLASPTGGVTWKTVNDEEVPDDFDMKKPPLAYGVSKTANFFLATEFARRFSHDPRKAAVIHNSYNPGNLKSELQRHARTSGGDLLWNIIDKLLLYPPVFGAYTELFCGFAPELGITANQGSYVVPWGRKTHPRKDVQAQVVGHDDSEDHKKNAERMFDWCERTTAKYA